MALKNKIINQPDDKNLVINQTIVQFDETWLHQILPIRLTVIIS